MIQGGSDEIIGGAAASDRHTRSEEQRGHVRKTLHMVKQKIKQGRINIISQWDQTMLKMLIASVDVAELYNPPRIVSMAAKTWLRAGWGMDITTHDVDGFAWGFNTPEMKNRVARRVLTDKPRLLIGSPTCTAHSVMDHINHARVAIEVVQERFVHARGHLEFATTLYKLQMQGGRYFLHEHPDGAPPWQEDCTRKVLIMEGVKRVVVDQCKSGLEPNGERGYGPARKPLRL